MALFAAVTPLSGHAVFVLLVQLALLLLVARLGAGVSRAFGLPAVVGELAAGIVLGPTVFGHYAPAHFAAVFPQSAEQFHLLEAVGVLGMVLLLLITGLETDLKLLRNLGRAALVASVLGMLVPFLFGFLLGLWMPAAFLPQPDQRVLFASFLATAMAISAMPVIAKILMDLDLTRRNIGLVILSAGVVDDTAGWLILSVIAGAATQGGTVRLAGLGVTFALMLVFLLGTAFVLYPILRVAFRLLSRTQARDTELVVIVAVTFLCAAATEWIGVHAVFGAFVAGTALRQVPHLNQDVVHRLESFVFSILAPVFFGTVGLHVDLWTLQDSGGTTMLGIVLAIACIGKLVGCTLGGLWGGLSRWEAISIAVAMNARGAMGLVLASIGLSLGILNQQMFSIIVVVAVATSFLAPVALRLTMRRVKMTRDEEQRILEEESRGVFDPEKMRLLVPTAGGPNAIAAARLAYGLAKRSSEPVVVVHVDERGTLFDRVVRFVGWAPARGNFDEHLASLKQLAGDQAMRVRHLTGRAAAKAVIEEAARGFDVILAGASGGAAKVGGRILEDIVEGAPCHVAIVKSGKNERALRKIFVPIDGSSVSRFAAEFALRYAEATGAELTLGILSDKRGAQISRHSTPDTLPEGPDETPSARSVRPGKPSDGDTTPAPADAATEAADELTRISPVFRVSEVKPIIVRVEYDPGLESVADAIERGNYDLVVLGAENRAVKRRLFFGHENERIINLESVTTTIVIPHAGRRRRGVT
jgi:Kef-type K+ transport system membrane component KefB/nucleotide-binding universal stress UspA family protein